MGTVCNMSLERDSNLRTRLDAEHDWRLSMYAYLIHMNTFFEYTHASVILDNVEGLY